ncbi:MAG: hypothetical protein U0X20_00980 [Caldilineaceae bacterium]
MADPYLGLIQEQWPNIASLYNEHADKYPVMLVDVREMEIHAFPFEEFRSLLDSPSQRALDEQYQRAVENRQMVLFVRDTERKIFQSYSLALEEEA